MGQLFRKSGTYIVFLSFFVLMFYGSRLAPALLLLLFFSSIRIDTLKTSFNNISLPSFMGLLVLIYVGFSLAWTTFPMASAVKYLSVVGLFLSGFLAYKALSSLEPKTNQTYLTALMSGLILAFCIVIANILNNHHLYERLTQTVYTPEIYAHGLSLLSIIGLSVVVYAARGSNKVWAGLVFCLLAFILFRGTNTVAKFAFLVGVSSWLAYSLFRQYWLKFIQVSMLVFLLFAPVFYHLVYGPLKLFYDYRPYKLSLLHRVEIWNFVTEKIIQNPLFGYGFGSSKSIEGGKDLIEMGPIWIQNPPFEPELKGPWLVEILPLHPHNAILQLWLELGFLGVLLVMVFLFFSFARLNQASKSARLLFAVSAPSLFIVLISSYGLWQGWWISTILLSFIILRLICHSIDQTKGSNDE